MTPMMRSPSTPPGPVPGTTNFASHPAMMPTTIQAIIPMINSLVDKNGLVRVLHLAGGIQHINRVGVRLADEIPIVVDLDQHVTFDLRHLVRRLAIRGEDVLELRQDEEALGLCALGVDDLDVVRRHVDDVAGPDLVDRGCRQRLYGCAGDDKRHECEHGTSVHQMVSFRSMVREAAPAGCRCSPDAIHPAFSWRARGPWNWSSPRLTASSPT